MLTSNWLRECAERITCSHVLAYGLTGSRLWQAVRRELAKFGRVYENPRADPRFMVYAGDRIFAVWVTVESGPVSKAVVTAVVEYRAV
ncbi:hypothetical protein [Pyrobaculum aerophilum]|uniref:hypothetical protein n=1 Tax=Pyrobaculum aerophilum TaxID=13773 RepID=UPI0023F21839|nr:hypothetical protein [Pyrobaculum aerophilum]MCX8137982.1 hypothetical protein [Pyrobaculum aerophilum]